MAHHASHIDPDHPRDIQHAMVSPPMHSLSASNLCRILPHHHNPSVSICAPFVARKRITPSALSTQHTPLRTLTSALLLLLLSLPSFAQTPSTQPTSARIILVTGLDYPGHPWKLTSPFIADALRKDKRLTVDIQEDPKFLASPKLYDYDVLVLNYMNWESPDPGPEARENLRKFVASGKGFILVHFTCGAFQDWPDFRTLAGRVYDPKLRPHDPRGPFHVDIADPNHPITKGLSSFDTDDELYTCLTGDTPIHILATARSKVDQKDYPIAFILDYGKGRVFHTVLGHDVKALTPPPVQDLFRRAAAWTAHLPPLTTTN